MKKKVILVVGVVTMIIGVTAPLDAELSKREELILELDAHILELDKRILELEEQNRTINYELQNKNTMLEKYDRDIRLLNSQNKALQEDLDQLVNEHEKYVRIDRNVDIPMAYKVHMYRLCNEYGVDYELALAVMVKESGGNPTALNTKNRNGTYDSGIMQINSTNHAWLSKELGIKDFNNPYDNMKAGVYMLSLFDYDNPHKILMAYNMGEGTMKKLFKQGITSTKYSRDVMAIYESLKG